MPDKLENMIDPSRLKRARAIVGAALQEEVAEQRVIAPDQEY